MTVDLTQDYFALFGLPRRFRIDGTALELAYQELQSQVHPDRYAHLSEAERRLSMQWATRVNEAYTTLRKPLARGLYLLDLAGVDAQHESNTAMAPAFLMEQMEWREAVEEAHSAADAGELEALHRKLRYHADGLAEELAGALDDRRDLHAAADLARRLMFVEKLQRDINDALEALES